MISGSWMRYHCLMPIPWDDWTVGWGSIHQHIGPCEGILESSLSSLSQREEYIHNCLLYQVHPFGLNVDLDTLQRLMDKILLTYRRYASTFLDNIVIHSMGWEIHPTHLKAVLESLRSSGWTAYSKKYHPARKEADGLTWDLHLGQEISNPGPSRWKP